jgi:hypothetical protein
MKTAKDILATIAPNEHEFTAAVFRPGGTYNGYMDQRRHKEYVLFWYLGKTLLAKREKGKYTHSYFIAERKTLENGQYYYQACLDPFGPDVGYIVKCDIAKELFNQYYKGAI